MIQIGGCVALFCSWMYFNMIWIDSSIGMFGYKGLGLQGGFLEVTLTEFHRTLHSH